MGIRYLGSKVRVLNDLAILIGEPNSQTARFVDAFSGTGTVAAMAADLGWPIHVNDHLRCARLLTTARLLAVTDVPFDSLGGYASAIEALNSSSPHCGFIWREYSPASSDRAPRPRNYFTEENARQLDGMRASIREWKEEGAISDIEETLLLADLIEAASSVANTAGTFGCFLSDWSSTALRTVKVAERSLRSEAVPFSTQEQDVFQLSTEPHDTVYLDPPYTKRQYAAYYHLLETIAYGDEPRVSGITGLRPWEDKASLFSYKRHALEALLKLVKQMSCRRILISYSDEGHIELEALNKGLMEVGFVRVHDLRTIPRYQPRRTEPQQVGEFLLELTCG